ncbi:MAG: helix-turn-helix domain-containing protein [Paenibacillaceae bacterium]|nr:helix-turn-helix domain-containing protein [Paenibacillaceae bacterium]
MERETTDAADPASAGPRTSVFGAFVGALQETRFASARRFGKAVCRPGWQWRHSHPWDDYTLWYVSGGQGHIRVLDEETALRRGTFVLLRPNDRLYATQTEQQPLSVIFTHFYAADRRSGIDLDILPRFTQTDNHFLFENELNHLLALQNGEEAFVDEEFDNVIKRLLIQLCRIHEKLRSDETFAWHHASMIRNAIARIREQIGTAVDFRDLAAGAYMSPPYFSRLFKQYTGESLKTFVARTKLEHAMAMLKDSSLRISDISDRLGYSDIYNFSKMFKLRYGISPSYYRQSLVKETAAPGGGNK